MAPQWARAVRPLVLVFTAIAFLITLVFDANVDAQGGAYATGVLVLITSAARGDAVGAAQAAARALTVGFGSSRRLRLHDHRQHHRTARRPPIAALFILGILVVSARLADPALLPAARDARSPSTRRRSIRPRGADEGEIRIVAHEPDAGNDEEYTQKNAGRAALQPHPPPVTHHLPRGAPPPTPPTSRRTSSLEAS